MKINPTTTVSTLAWLQTPTTRTAPAEQPALWQTQDSYAGALPAAASALPAAETAAIPSTPAPPAAQPAVRTAAAHAPVTLTMLEEAEPVWVPNGNQQVRTLPAQPGQVAWQEVQPQGRQTYLWRKVPAQDGGPDWSEFDFPGQMRSALRERHVPASDGGPAWKEVEGVSKTRTVPASDGGPDWREVDLSGVIYSSRKVASQDSKPDWLEYISAGVRSRSREYEENGVSWRETIEGSNRWRYPQGGVDRLTDLARAQGTTILTVDGCEIHVHGHTTPQQLEYLRAALEAMPAQARVYAREICVSDTLGETLDEHGQTRSKIAGLAGEHQIALSRHNLTSGFRTQRLVYHEAGHRAERALSQLQSDAGWGDGTSVSHYGRTNAREDYAETHRVVLMDFPHYQRMSASDWAGESQARKKMQVVALYGGTVPSWEEVQAAETEMTRKARAAMESADAKTTGKESGRVHPSQDGGDPWVDHLEGDRLVDSRRDAPAQDGGPNWQQFRSLSGEIRSERHFPADDGGEAWKEVRVEGLPGYFRRSVPASDGGPAWGEVKTAHTRSLIRLRKAEGQTWKETLKDGQIERTPWEGLT